MKNFFAGFCIRILLLSLSFCFLFVSCKPSLEFSELPLGGDFSEKDKSGKLVSLKDFKEPVLLVFFGYTYCPDFCPNMLSKIKNAEQMLDEKTKSSFRTVFISIDPLRDSPETVQKYVSFFLKNVSGFSFDQATTNRLVKQYAAFVEETKDGTIDHSTYVYVLDGNRKTRKLLKSTEDAETFAKTIESLGRNPVQPE
ncbi:SCO family protein [Leptospira ilyithenensis]|uniref:SCO family protein n=1 Tax=Leptospira ilyithenensis TaxID=2484901 RepID=A0A4R9LRP8_9LEPT|nr:SCO family protein [Leptospira ilyithenensis]TGN13754.1 SCO family protein [Leptospira ilyithenensis]